MVLLSVPLWTFLLNTPLNLFLIPTVVLLRVPPLNLSCETSFQLFLNTNGVFLIKFIAKNEQKPAVPDSWCAPRPPFWQTGGWMIGWSDFIWLWLYKYNVRCLYVNIFYILKGIGRFLNKKRCEKLLKDRRQNSRKTTQPTLARHGTSQPTNVVPTWPKMALKNPRWWQMRPKKNPRKFPKKNAGFLKPSAWPFLSISSLYAALISPFWPPKWPNITPI